MLTANRFLFVMNTGCFIFWRGRAFLVVACAAMLLVTPWAGAASVELFSGGWQSAQGAALWAERFGSFTGDAENIHNLSGVATTGQDSSFWHAEAQRLGYMGADFTYSGDVSVDPAAEAHLQFRISDRGRYGVRLRPGSLTLYRFLRLDKPCFRLGAPPAISHCPAWGDTDPLIYGELKSCSFGSQDCGCPAINQRKFHRLSITATGLSFTVAVDGVPCIAITDSNLGNALLVGRFGIYVLGSKNALSAIKFRNVGATTDPTAASNFALLYSTAGYEAVETKRALVRTLNDVPSQLIDGAHSTFSVLRGRTVVLTGQLVPLLEPGSTTLAKTFGMQLLEANFTQLQQEGFYKLRVEIATATGPRTLYSAPFEIRGRLVSTNLLKGLSLLNAAARRAADEDMRRNWCFETATGCTNNPAVAGPWSVAEDGAFFADRANSNQGAVLRRVFNGNNAPFSPDTEFHYVGEVTIISGCDAQLQFGVTPNDRWAVTLQAGAGGGCPFGGGPGAVRLHHEDGRGMHIVTAHLFPANNPFVAGHPYDVDITVAKGKITVVVDGGIVRLDNIPAPLLHLGFALKAWASTARFRRVQAWDESVDLRRSSGGTRIPFYRAHDQTGAVISVPCQSWFQVGNALDPAEKSRACNPFFSQLSGFHDCNNLIGEATSHGAFLAGLMAIWTGRASGFSQAERETLRQAIITNVLYIEELFQEANGTGEFAHSEMGRGGVETNLGPWLSQYALYGESAFADSGASVDPRLAKMACSRSVQSAGWLKARHLLDDPTESSIIYAHIARCAGREGLPGSAQYWQEATKTAHDVLTNFFKLNAIADAPRDTGRIVPWFEGVYEVARSRPAILAPRQHEQLNSIAKLLMDHLTKEHVCDDAAAGPLCPKNAFLVLPQASGDEPIWLANWKDMQSVPQVVRPAGLPYIHFYSVPHFAVVASDAVYLGRLTGRRDLELLASGDLNWILGLNPGVPASESVSPQPQQPWQAASFTYNLPSGSVRSMDGWRTRQSSSKGWLAEREVSAASPRHESWWIDPLNNGFLSIVNGHVIWDRQWDYVNSGGTEDPISNVGWSSGETFLLDDGVFIKAALLLEDWLSPGPLPAPNPYNLQKLAFFDTTYIDRLSADWGFDNPDLTLYAQAGRAATNFCNSKGFSGGRFTGHYLGEHIGLLCTPASGRFFDITPIEIRASGWNFFDINTTPWAQVSRAATVICNKRGFVGGFFTGHQLNGTHGLICLQSDVAHWFDATLTDLRNSGEGFADINNVPWAKAARAATNICVGKRFSGGFFTGHQLNGKQGVVCLSQ